MASSCEIEDLVMQGIDVLRKERRKRPTIKDLYFYVQEFDEENILDFDNFHELKQNMIKKNLYIIRMVPMKQRNLFISIKKIPPADLLLLKRTLRWSVLNDNPRQHVQTH